MQSDNQKNRKIVRELIFAGLLAVFILLFFLDFIRSSNERIVQQNANYVQDSTMQVAERIEDVFTAAKDSVEAMAHLYGESLETPEIDEKKLKEMLENSPFDRIGFVNREGFSTNTEGTTSDASNWESYTEGMKGNAGYFVVNHYQMKDEAILIFYAPLRCKGEIIGVLQGAYMEERIKQILVTEFFGTQAKNYLCESDGTVIISVGAENVSENMLVKFPDTMKVSEEQFAEIKKAFQEHTSYGYSYDGTQGTGSAYLTAIPNSDFILLQTFPSAVTNAMSDDASEVGIELETKLIVAFGIYILCLLLTRWKSRKKLVSENQEMSQIVQGVTQLFERFVVLDLEKNTYRYLKNKEKELPSEGSHQEMVDYFTPRYMADENDMDMSCIISKEYIQEHLDKNIPYLQYEYQIQRESQRWENMSILCLKREADAPQIVLLAIQDVTALKENEIRNRTALKEAFEAADEANHAKSDFLSRMSHDIRTPMNAIMGMTAVAAMHIEDRERLMDCLNKITLSSRHLLALINDVLDMSKIESGKVSLSVEEFEISETVESLLAIMHPQIEAKKQRLKVSITHISHEGVIGDPLRLQQVFVNIMGNAVKFTPEGGTISFSIHEKPSHIQGSGCYEFIFEDTGMGMSQEFIEKIFEPFARADNASRKNIEGTGLGMPIARNIVRMMNGDIQIESEPGVGSRFTVMVYLKLQDMEKDNDAEFLKELRVLVADDEEDACENTCEILNSIGMYADGVLSGDAAIQKMESAYERAEEYDVVILDWKMPGKNGVETTREIREKLGDEVPIIILSAYDWSSIEEEAKEAGVNAFIAKPLFKSRLLYVLKSVVGNQEKEETSDMDVFEQSDFSGRKVLLVEDNELNREIAVELLTCIGIEVDEAHDGQEAVDMLLDKPENYYDLVFMDIQMPVKNGYEASREIRQADRADLKTLPIVAMSADAFSDDIQKASVAGMNDHVAKPVELPKLLGALEKWIK